MSQSNYSEEEREIHTSIAKLVSEKMINYPSAVLNEETDEQHMLIRNNIVNYIIDLVFSLWKAQPNSPGEPNSQGEPDFNRVVENMVETQINNFKTFNEITIEITHVVMKTLNKFDFEIPRSTIKDNVRYSYEFAIKNNYKRLNIAIFKGDYENIAIIYNLINPDTIEFVSINAFYTKITYSLRALPLENKDW